MTITEDELAQQRKIQKMERSLAGLLGWADITEKVGHEHKWDTRFIGHPPPGHPQPYRQEIPRWGRDNGAAFQLQCDGKMNVDIDEGGVTVVYGTDDSNPQINPNFREELFVTEDTDDHPTIEQTARVAILRARIAQLERSV